MLLSTITPAFIAASTTTGWFYYYTSTIDQAPASWGDHAYNIDEASCANKCLLDPDCRQYRFSSTLRCQLSDFDPSPHLFYEGRTYNIGVKIKNTGHINAWNYVIPPAAPFAGPEYVCAITASLQPTLPTKYTSQAYVSQSTCGTTAPSNIGPLFRASDGSLCFNNLNVYHCDSNYLPTICSLYYGLVSSVGTQTTCGLCPKGQFSSGGMTACKSLNTCGFPQLLIENTCLNCIVDAYPQIAKGVGTCICRDNNAAYNPFTNNCDCPLKMTKQNNNCITCPANSYIDPIKGCLCLATRDFPSNGVCDSNAVNQASAKILKSIEATSDFKSCGAHSSLVNGACKCSTGYTLIETTCTINAISKILLNAKKLNCVGSNCKDAVRVVKIVKAITSTSTTCTFPLVSVLGQCVCTSNYQALGSGCTPCLSGSASTAGNQCLCSDGSLPPLVGNCPTICPAMEEFANGRCQKCPNNSNSVAGGRCSCNSKSQPPIAGKCSPCPSGKQLIKGKCQRCPPGQIVDGVKCST